MKIIQQGKTQAEILGEELNANVICKHCDTKISISGVEDFGKIIYTDDGLILGFINTFIYGISCLYCNKQIDISNMLTSEMRKYIKKNQCYCSRG